MSVVMGPAPPAAVLPLPGGPAVPAHLLLLAADFSEPSSEIATDPDAEGALEASAEAGVEADAAAGAGAGVAADEEAAAAESLWVSPVAEPAGGTLIVR